MKVIVLILICLITSTMAFASIPTEEGLLRNLNNQSINGNTVTLKLAVVKQEESKTTTEELEYYKLVLTNEENPQVFQIKYSNSQMLLNQIVDLKYISNLSQQIRSDKNIDRNIFYSALALISLNNSTPFENTLAKNGVNIVKNKNLINEEKMKLLRQYRSYLSTNKGKGEVNSPLNPTDPAVRSKNLEVFKENTYKKSGNIKLVRENNEFFWRADWKSLVGLFSNEERRLRSIKFNNSEIETSIDLSDYVSFNGVNEIPKNIYIKDLSGQNFKVQIYAEEVKSSNKEKSLLERFEEAKKQAPKNLENENKSFMY